MDNVDCVETMHVVTHDLRKAIAVWLVYRVPGTRMFIDVTTEGNFTKTTLSRPSHGIFA